VGGKPGALRIGEALERALRIGEALEGAPSWFCVRLAKPDRTLGGESWNKFCLGEEAVGDP